VLLNVVAITQAGAKHYSNGNTGVVVSHKTGASARVGAAYATKFQAYIDDLEAAGAEIHALGGVRRGRCSSGHMHPCGKAIDVCQLRRGVVSSRCRLPDRNAIAVIAAKHGLFEGGQWCNHDYGHAQVGVSAPACGTQTVAAKQKRKTRYVSSARRRTSTAGLQPKPEHRRYSNQIQHSESYRLHGEVQNQWGTGPVRLASANQVRRSRYVGGQSYHAYYNQ